MRFKIGIDISPLSRKFYSGTEWYLWQLISALIKKPAASNYDWQLYTPNSITESLSLPINWKLVRLFWPSRRLWLKGRLSLRLLIKPPDLLFMPANALPFFLPDKVVSTVHDLGFKEYPEVYNQGERLNQNLAIRRVLKKSRLIIAISESTKKAIYDHYPQSAKSTRICVIPLAIDSARFASKTDFLKKSKSYLLFVGRICKKKNLLSLIKAYKKLMAEQANQDVELWLVGTPGYGWAEIKEEIKRTKGVKHFFWQPNDKLTQIILGAKALILPSYAEGFGLPVLEAQAAGVPAVCADIPILREVAGDAARYFCLSEANDLKLALNDILNNEQMRAELIAKGLINQKRFSLSKLADATLAAFEMVRQG